MQRLQVPSPTVERELCWNGAGRLYAAAGVLRAGEAQAGLPPGQAALQRTARCRSFRRYLLLRGVSLSAPLALRAVCRRASGPGQDGGSSARDYPSPRVRTTGMNASDLAPVTLHKGFIADPDRVEAQLKRLDWERRDGAPRCEYYCNDLPEPYTYGSGKYARTYFPREALKRLDQVFQDESAFVEADGWQYFGDSSRRRQVGDVILDVEPRGTDDWAWAHGA